MSVIEATTAPEGFEHAVESVRIGDVYDRALRLVTTGRVDLELIVTHCVPLDDAPAALEMQSRYEDEVIKTVRISGARRVAPSFPEEFSPTDQLAPAHWMPPSRCCRNSESRYAALVWPPPVYQARPPSNLCRHAMGWSSPMVPPS